MEEIDAVEILVLIDNELDPISKPIEGLEATGNIAHIGLASPDDGGIANGWTKQLKMEQICCAAHGLSLLITAIKGTSRRTILFDAGPEGTLWELNAKRRNPRLEAVEKIFLSHWHRDHSGGLTSAVRLIKEAREDAGFKGRVTVDVHPNRPEYRGFRTQDTIVSLEADPTFEELEEAGATVNMNDTPQLLWEGWLLASGEIDRETTYELGLQRGMRFESRSGKWEEDQLIRDERFLACKIKGKGLVVFTGCSHAGVVNTARHAVRLAGSPVHAIVGGYHLADADDEKIKATVEDLAKLDPMILLAGHCTGWRAKFQMEQAMPGRLAPASVGLTYRVSADIAK